MSDEAIIKAQQAQMIANAAYLADFYNNDDLASIDIAKALMKDRNTDPAMAIAFGDHFEILDMHDNGARITYGA